MKATTDENPIISVQYCTGYVDKQNNWRPGFNCSVNQPSKQPNSTPLFCCGTNTHKYCCSTRQYIQLGYPGGHANDLTYGTLLTVVLSTFIFSVMLTIIAFVCCKKFWKSRENLNLELVDDQSLYANTNFVTLNATQLINAYSANGLPVQSTNAIQSASTPTSSMNALAQQQPALLSPSSTATNNLATNSINNSLPAIATSISSISPMASGQTGQPLGALYTSTSNATPYTISHQHQNAMNQPANAGLSGQSSITMTGYSMHPQALQQALIFYEPPPPYNSSLDIHRTYPTGEASSANQATAVQQPTNCMTAVRTANDPHSASNIDLNTINMISASQAASASYQPPANAGDSGAPANADLPANTNIWSQRLLLALGNYRRDCIYPVVDQPRKKLCRTLSQ